MLLHNSTYSVKLIIVKDVDSMPKSSVGCSIEKYDTITKITKTVSLGKLKIVYNVANPDTEIRLSEEYTRHCSGDQIERNMMGRACSMSGGEAKFIQGFGG